MKRAIIIRLAVGMTGCIQDQQADTAKLYLVSFGQGKTRNVVTPVEIVGCESVLDAPPFRAEFAVAVHDLNGFRHGEYLPGRRRGIYIYPGIFPLEIWDDPHMIEMRM